MNLEERIKAHEGYSDRIYKDSEGVLTVGWGFALQEGKYVPHYVCERLFWISMKKARQAWQRVSKRLGIEIDPARAGVCIEMIFNVGVVGFVGFKRMLAALKAKDYDRAADEMLDSKWAYQVKNRAVTLAKIMRTGEEK